MIFYDENGNVYYLEVSNNQEVVKALELQTEKLENLEIIVENQAAALENSQERYVIAITLMSV